MSEAGKKYGWIEIAFADGTDVAFCRQRNELANTADVNAWSLFGGIVGDGSMLETLVARAHAEFGGDHRYRIVKKLARRAINEMRSKEWDQVIRGPVADWARERISALAAAEECVDNQRVALKGNTGQVRRYRRQQSRGCCGSHDSEEACPIDGKTYLLGFNFGH